MLSACGEPNDATSQYVVAESFISFSKFKALYCDGMSDATCFEAHLLAFQDALIDYYNLDPAAGTFKICQLDPPTCRDFRRLEAYVLAGNKL
jgi:hypothetical protein